MTPRILDAMAPDTQEVDIQDVWLSCLQRRRLVASLPILDFQRWGNSRSASERSGVLQASVPVLYCT